MPSGKQAPPDRAAAPVAAGARLQTMRRRVRLSRTAVWALIASGPLALTLALTTDPTVVEAAGAHTPARVRTAAVAQASDPSGYAQLFTDAWLRSRAGDAQTAQARLAQSMAPDVELPDAATAQPVPQTVTAVRSAQHSDDAWSVTVAVQYADGRLLYYAVPVAADADGRSFTVTGAPAVVAGPGRAKTPASPYGVAVPDGDLSTTVAEFLAAYLTGAGEVDRYLAPGATARAVSPPPFTTVSVRQLTAVEETATAEVVPADGTRVRVRASVEARDRAGRWPLSYDLALTARSGRWEIASLNTDTDSNSSRTGGTK
ncbi:conjugal transfer protein [Streptomyces sp. NPDC093094]|uniref:conjugal transfer protein n=1 Tax=Streptomyces sp. NPDC093094 TaxID=3366026 RepID=UPI0038289940